MTRTTTRLANQLESAKESSKTWEKHYDSMKTARDELQEDQKTTLDAVIDALGIRDAYPDITTTETGYRNFYNTVYAGGYYGPYTRRTPVTEEYQYDVTDFGRDRFKADVLEAVSAQKSSKAVKRLAKALKAAK